MPLSKWRPPKRGDVRSKKREPDNGIPSTALHGVDDSVHGDWCCAILEPHGWQLYHASGDYGLWTRPGKSKAAGPSASTNYRGNGLLHVFSSNAAPFMADCNYSRFAAFALLEHGGDFFAAAAEIARWRMV